MADNVLPGESDSVSDKFDKLQYEAKMATLEHPFGNGGSTHFQLREVRQKEKEGWKQRKEGGRKEGEQKMRR